MFCALFAGLLCAVYPPTPKTPKLENGFYEILDEQAKEGVSFPRSDGDGNLILGNRRGDAFGRAEIASYSNDNSRLSLSLPDALPTGMADEKKNLIGREVPELALVIEGICIRAHVIHTAGANTEPMKYFGSSGTIAGLDNARKLATFFKTDVKLRRHPGHQLLVKWIPEREGYAAGETVKLKLEITNAGTERVCIEIFDWSSRNQPNDPGAYVFRFLAEALKGNGKPMPGLDAQHRVSPGRPSYFHLKSGESCSTIASLENWYEFKDPDTYRITGTCEAQICDPGDDTESKKVLWNELLVAECRVKVKK